MSFLASLETSKKCLNARLVHCEPVVNEKLNNLAQYKEQRKKGNLVQLEVAFLADEEGDITERANRELNSPEIAARVILDLFHKYFVI